MPVELDIIENFDFEHEAHKKALLKNKYLLVGNLGVPGSKYIENTKVNKYLNLHFHSKNLIKQVSTSRTCQTPT